MKPMKAAFAIISTILTCGYPQGHCDNLTKSNFPIRKFSSETAGKITKGMTYLEVVNLLGVKEGKYSDKLLLPPNKSCIFDEVVWWEDETGAIGIIFDKFARVAFVVRETRGVQPSNNNK